MNEETPLGPLNKAARALMRLPIEVHRERLPDFGLTAAARSWSGSVPRRGPMTPR